MKSLFTRDDLKLILAELEGRQEALCQGLAPACPDQVFQVRRHKYRIIEKIRQIIR